MEIQPTCLLKVHGTKNFCSRRYPNEVLTQSGRKTYISFNPQFWKMQQKLPKWAKSIKPCWNEAILIVFAPKCFVEFSVKALMPFEVIQKYWKFKEKQFLPLGVVWINRLTLNHITFYTFSLGRGECFRYTILDALLLGGETILECKGRTFLD